MYTITIAFCHSNIILLSCVNFKIFMNCNVIALVHRSQGSIFDKVAKRMTTNFFLPEKCSCAR